MRLQDKVVVITGSGSGLGREAALLFAAEGATVVTSDRVVGRAQAVAKEIEAMGGNSAAFDADVREEAAVETLVSQAVDAFGRIDVMWANAGIPEPGFGARQFVDSRLEDWNDIFSVNVTGIYLAWKHAAKWMITNGRPGTLLATTSASAFVAYPGFTALDMIGPYEVLRHLPGGRTIALQNRLRGRVGAGQTRDSGQRALPDSRHVGQFRVAPGD